MNKKTYYQFHIQDDNGESSWTPLRLEVQLNAEDNSPVASFQLFFAHITHLDTLQQDFYLFERHLLLFQTYDKNKMSLFFKKLIDQCYATKKPLETLAEYAFNIRELFRWPNAPTPLPPSQYPIPTYAWLINANESNTSHPEETLDKRITIDINWVDETQNKSFRGYWYFVSTSFFKQKIESTDPYYRRFALVAKTFKKEYVDEKLTELTNYLATVKQSEREDYLKYHFEYDGQSMFYNR